MHGNAPVLRSIPATWVMTILLCSNLQSIAAHGSVEERRKVQTGLSCHPHWALLTKVLVHSSLMQHVPDRRGLTNTGQETMCVVQANPHMGLL